ncbi:MAG: D-alanyl-D-alanine carboxypeptidase [Candidatus Omnitrophica bacterium]|nr:D-alanyl-D-alanine carboxypeptidase [Candidatus Omnitrophota bacterium]
MRAVCALGAVSLLLAAVSAEARPRSKTPSLSARSAVILDADNGGVLFSKNPHLRLPPASTTKVMTVILAMERLPFDRQVPVSATAAGAAPSRAGLSAGARYTVRDLVTAALVSSSNDAAVALAEAVAGNESAFAELMNDKAGRLGMRDTKFINATGLTERKRRQYSTASDLAILMRLASGHRTIDRIMGITTTVIVGSDGKPVFLKSHNKMLWRMPKFVKGKTGWTAASLHTFVGTDYEPDKRIIFAMLYSKKPWVDIENLATLGRRLEGRGR